MIGIGYRRDLLSGPISLWLDHFRWISALLVAAAHLRNILLPDAGNLKWLEVPFYFLTLFGTQSVVIFFVISGLLVGGVVLRTLDGGSLAAGKFGLDRAVRLYTALIPAVLLSVALQWAVGAHDCELPDSLSLVFGNLFYLQNFTVEPLCNNHPLWSLSSEAYFYLIGPVAIMACVRRSWKLALLAMAFLLPPFLFSSPSYSNPIFGLVLWLMGLLPWFLRLRLPGWLMAALFCLVLLASRVHAFPSKMLDDFLVACTFAMLLASDLSRITPPFPQIAKKLSGFSYSLYLVHMPIAQAFGVWIGYQMLPNASPKSYGIYFGVLACIISVARCFGFLFESRTRDIRNALNWLIVGRNGIQSGTSSKASST